MVARKVWIASVGTYTVETASDVFNPTAGRIFFSPDSQAASSSMQDEIQLTMEDELSMRPGLLPFLRVAELATLATLEQSTETPGSYVARGTPTEIAI
jgi:Ca2+-transporting ATPase